MRRWYLALAIVALSGCEDKTHEAQQDARLATLENVTRDLQVNELIADKPAANEVPSPSKPAYDLVTKWPGADPAEHRAYLSRAACESARAVILQDNKRRADAAEAEVGTVNAAGQRIIAVGGPAVPTALCVPAG